MGDAPGLTDTALRALLLAETEAEARAELDEATIQADETVRRAQHEAEALVTRTRLEGAHAGELAAAAERAQARRHARRLVLEARRTVYDEFRSRALDAVLELRQLDGYPALLERLAERARAQLGEDAILEIDPPEGGVRAQAGTRRVDYSLPALAERCIAGLGEELAELWR
jgi:vacuolar-type H+-ATPase subunit E/Vma4